MDEYTVYIRVDDAGRVVAINSSAFVQDTEGWTAIDSGHGDRYHHAQGNYLDGALWDEYGVYRYKLEDGKVAERTEAEMGTDYDSMQKEPALTVDQRVSALEEAIEMILSGVTE